VRCPPELLGDVSRILAQVRAWPGVVETKPGIFYARRAPFLHFHLSPDGRRRADIKGRSGWHPFELPVPISATRRAAFLRELRKRYAEREPS
jgi:hypothetical protein